MGVTAALARRRPKRYPPGVIEITLSGVDFDAQAIMRSDGQKGRVLTFTDPASKIQVSIPATEGECDHFARIARGGQIKVPTPEVPHATS